MKITVLKLVTLLLGVVLVLSCTACLLGDGGEEKPNTDVSTGTGDSDTTDTTGPSDTTDPSDTPDDPSDTTDPSDTPDDPSDSEEEDNSEIIARLKAGAEELTVDDFTTEPADQIKYSLDLPTETAYGDAISWKSSNQAVITNSGRVIRPRSDESAETVTLTATVSSGELSEKKELTLTVEPDADYLDPSYISSDYMTDEEFFGFWDGSAWLLEGKFDYSREDMKEIEAAAKEGNYKKASEKLLEHMREREVKSPVELQGRSTGYVDMVLDDIFALQNLDFYQGSADITAPEYTEVYVPISTGVIAKGGVNTYTVMARYNESSSLIIASKESGMGARVELTVNGEVRSYDVDADAMIRTGQYKNTCYGSEHEMEATMFGEFLGDRTSRVMLRFRFSDLIDTDVVTAARLVLYAKVTPAYAETKSIVVIYETNNIWEENDVCWNDIRGCVYNYNGVPGGTDWEDVKGSDNEYSFQMARFTCWRRAASEYLATGDESYPYRMIRQMMDYIYDKGKWMPSPDVSWGYQQIRGGWPRTLDTAGRLRAWVGSIDTIIQSRYMTPECCTTILKHIWDMNDVLLRSVVTTNNWAQNEGMAVIEGALTMPEFAKAEAWIDYGSAKNEALMFANNFSDGSYAEATGSYNVSAYSRFMEYKRLMFSCGRSVTPEYDEMLRKAAYYNLLLRGPGGENLQYGDEGAGKSTGRRFPELMEWYDDKEIEFLDTFGRQGTEPEWTSRLFPDSRVTMMRADWSTTTPFIFTNVRGGGSHAHADDNSITAIAYGRILLNDAGIFTYSGGDPYRIWGTSTEAHNTVEVNGVSQMEDYDNKGVIHDWATNDAYDFLSQSTKSYSHIGVDHRRSITFIKPNIWIVSDLMTTDSADAQNSYKQIWHMLPSSNLATDANEKTIFSNFSSGANIILASADDDAAVVEKDGWYDFGYQNLTSSKFAYFEKADAVGATTFDTVIIPYEQSGATVDVERIELGVPTSEATALKFDSDVDGEKATTYYLLDYVDSGAEKTMEGYRTDAQLTVVRVGENGELLEVIFNSGSSLRKTDGTTLVDAADGVNAFAYEIDGDTVKIFTDAESVDGVKIYVNGAINNVTVNESAIAFAQNGNILTLGE